MSGGLFAELEDQLSNANFSSPTGKVVSDQYNKAIEQAWAEYQKKVEVYQRQYVSQLEKLKSQAVAAENYAEASIIHKEIKKYKQKIEGDG